MADTQAVKDVGLVSYAEGILVKLGSAVLRMTRAALVSLFKAYIKMIHEAVKFLLGIVTIDYPISGVFSQGPFKRVEEPSEPVVNSRDVVNGVKIVRNAAVGNIDLAFGTDIKWDTHLIKEKMKRFRECAAEGDENKIAEIVKEIEELNKPFLDGSYENGYMEDSFASDETVDGTEAENERPTNILESKSKKTEVSEEMGRFALVRKGDKQNKKYDHRHDKILTQEKVSKHKLSDTNNRLEEVLKVSATLVHELTGLNNRISRMICVNEKMADIQLELGLGRKMLHEVEADRNRMKQKLLTLESMIKEEEKYLEDVSCESGYDESENPHHQL